MHERRIPEWLRHAPAPSVRGFAMLAGFEAVARGILISVFPLMVYRALQDTQVVSQIYFFIGIVSLISGLLVPVVTRRVPRRWVYIIGALMFSVGSLITITGTPAAVVVGLLLNTVGVVLTFVCFNAYVLDYISKIELGDCETSRMFYSALGWTVGPVLGVFLLKWWEPAPFLISALAILGMLGMFLFMRLGNGKLIVRATASSSNTLAYVPKFLRRRRLVAGWIFAVVRSSGWWVYVVYLPIFAVENGLSAELGGTVLSITNATLFITPLMFRWIKHNSVKVAVRTGFLASAMLFFLAYVVAEIPVFTVGVLMCGSFFLILLDISGGLPFLLVVKPSERTEMSAIYSSYRDVSGIITPGAAWLVLLLAPISGVFVLSGAALLGAWGLAGQLHPDLGRKRIRMQK
jgi:MFS transporter, ACDE family, multidrug resistance protein